MNKKIIYKILFIFLFTIIIFFVFSSKGYSITSDYIHGIAKDLHKNGTIYRIIAEQGGKTVYTKEGSDVSHGKELDVKISDEDKVFFEPGKEIIFKIIYRTKDTRDEHVTWEYTANNWYVGDVITYVDENWYTYNSEKDAMGIEFRFYPSEVTYLNESRNYSKENRNIWFKLDPNTSKAAVSVNFDIFFKTKNPGYIEYYNNAIDAGCMPQVFDYDDKNEKISLYQGGSNVIKKGTQQEITSSECRFLLGAERFDYERGNRRILLCVYKYISFF